MNPIELLRCLPFVRVAEPIRFPPGSGAGQRTAPRRTLMTEARVRSAEADDGPLPLRLAEVSTTGAFVHSDLLLPVGSPVEVAFTLPNAEDVVASGRVVRVEERAGHGGMGIHFERMPAEARAGLRAFTHLGHA